MVIICSVVTKQIMMVSVLVKWYAYDIILQPSVNTCAWFTAWLHHTTTTYCIAPNSHGTIFSWMSWLTSRSRKSYSRIGVHKVAYIVHSLKNRWGNIESWKFKVITKFLSQKFTLMLVWNNSWNIWTTKLGALRYSQAHRWVFQFMCDSYMVSPEEEDMIELY